MIAKIKAMIGLQKFLKERVRTKNIIGYKMNWISNLTTASNEIVYDVMPAPAPQLIKFVFTPSRKENSHAEETNP